MTAYTTKISRDPNRALKSQLDKNLEAFTEHILITLAGAERPLSGKVLARNTSINKTFYWVLDHLVAKGLILRFGAPRARNGFVYVLPSRQDLIPMIRSDYDILADHPDGTKNYKISCGVRQSALEYAERYGRGRWINIRIVHAGKTYTQATWKDLP